MRKTIVKKVTLSLSILLLHLLLVVPAFADVDCDGGPGLPGEDPDAPTTGCDVPLDNWLIILVIGGLILATWYLHNKQKKEAIA